MVSTPLNMVFRKVVTMKFSRGNFNSGLFYKQVEKIIIIGHNCNFLQIYSRFAGAIDSLLMDSLLTWVSIEVSQNEFTELPQLQ